MRRGALVSVVIPCYNPKPFLRETLASVRNQSHWPIETILVNDGTDNAEGLALLQSLASSVTRSIEQPNHGLPAARNAGFRAAAGAYVLPLDADDRIAPGFVAECLAALEAHPEAAFGYTDYRIFGDEERVYSWGEYNLYHLLDQNIICYASLIRRADWELAGGYDESMRMGYEDWDFWLRLGERGRFGHRLPRALFEYRKHGPSLYTTALDHHRELVEKIRSSHPDLYSHAARVRIKTRWKPSVCVVRDDRTPLGMEEQTIDDIDIVKCKEPLEALDRSRAPAFLIPDAAKVVARQSAELCALAVWSGRARLRLPDGSLAIAREALAATSPPTAQPRAWLGNLTRIFRSPARGAAETPARTPPDYLVHPGVPDRRRIALVTAHLGAAASGTVLLEAAQAIDRSRWELLVIATQSAAGASDSAARARWEQAVDHIYDLPLIVTPEQITAALFFLARNWKIDALVIHNSLAGYGVLEDLRKALPAIQAVELVQAADGEWSSESARLSTECRPDLRIVVTEEGRRWWRGLNLEQPAPCAGIARALLLAGPEFEDRSVATDAFFPAGQPGARPELPGVEVNFGDCLQLSGLRFCEKGGLFTLELEWRCLNPVARPLRCFAHVVDREGHLLGSLDHEILRAAPPLADWKPGDAGYEARCLVLPAESARGATLRLGAFDSETGLRTPVWASTLPLVDDYTTAVVESNRAPAAGCLFEMRPAPVEECDVRFEGGLRLTGRSFLRAGGVGWLRLRWSMLRQPAANLHFFGHVVTDPSPAAPILLSFDQDTGLSRMRHPGGEELVVVQDIVRNLSALTAEARFLRAGLFDMERPEARLAVRSSSLPMSKRENAVYLPLEAALHGAGEASAARR